VKQTPLSHTQGGRGAASEVGLALASAQSDQPCQPCAQRQQARRLGNHLQAEKGCAFASVAFKAPLVEIAWICIPSAWLCPDEPRAMQH
jgi:hypothetical protein